MYLPAWTSWLVICNERMPRRISAGVRLEAVLHDLQEEEPKERLRWPVDGVPVWCLGWQAVD